ncbi:MAG: aldehyde dehydrogenase family protein [Antricoccus sp.]
MSSLLPFEDQADAIAKANDTEYGLSGSIWARDFGRATRVSRKAAPGNLSDDSSDAFDSFTEIKSVFYATD